MVASSERGAQEDSAQMVDYPSHYVIFAGSLLFQRTYSLKFQTIIVVIAQTLTIILFFTSSANNSTIGVGLSINSLWVWMIPVVIGFVRVGTQSQAKDVSDAFKVGYKAIPTFERYVPRIRIRTVDHQRARRLHQSYRDSSGNGQTFVFGMLVQADEYNPGPIYNYARAWSHMNFVEKVVDSFDQLLHSHRHFLPTQTRNPVSDLEHPNASRMGPPQVRMELDHENLLLYPQRSPHGVTQNMVISGLIALLTQILTTGSAVYMAYK